MNERVKAEVNYANALTHLSKTGNTSPSLSILVSLGGVAVSHSIIQYKDHEE
jgi:hypothetical protein